MRPNHRIALIAGGVALVHLGALWGLHNGLVRPATTIVVPVTLQSELIAPPPPPPPPPAAPAPTPPPPAAQPRPPAPEPPRPIPPPRPAAVATAPAPAPSPALPSVVPSVVPAPVAAPPAPTAAPASPPPAPAAPAPRVELPSSDASYLRNPAPFYPPTSKRLGEQGQVLVRVLIGADGVPQQAEIKRSSGFSRLDQSAQEYVMKSRYLPGKVGGVPQAMWHEASVTFVL